MCDGAFMHNNNNGCLNPCARNILKTSHSSDRAVGIPCRITEVIGDSDDHENYAARPNSMTTCQLCNFTHCQLCTDQNTSFESLRNEEILARDDGTSEFCQHHVCDLCIPCTSDSATCVYCFSNTCNTEQYSHQINPNDPICETCYVQSYNCELCESSPRFKSYISPMDNPPSHPQALHKSSPQCQSSGYCFPKPACCLPASYLPQCCGTLSSIFPTQPTYYPYTGPFITIYSNETRLNTD